MKKTIFAILLAMPLLGACHREARPAWQTAKAVPHLNIPSGMDSPGIASEMRVPEPAGEVQGSVHGQINPPTSITLGGIEDIDKAWARVVAKLENSRVGTIIERDDTARRLALRVLGANLPGADAGFWWRMFHRAPPADAEYFATVNVQKINGKTRVVLDGDGRAVLFIDRILEDASDVGTVSQAGDAAGAGRP